MLLEWKQHHNHGYGFRIKSRLLQVKKMQLELAFSRKEFGEKFDQPGYCEGKESAGFLD